jgi:Ca2+-binding RTX toxin-like protein
MYPTLLGTGSDDVLRIDSRFSSLLGGRGNDEFFGGSDRNRIDKLYGGEGDDLFRWSPGFNIVHKDASRPAGAARRIARLDRVPQRPLHRHRRSESAHRYR